VLKLSVVSGVTFLKHIQSCWQITTHTDKALQPWSHSSHFSEGVAS